MIKSLHYILILFIFLTALSCKKQHDTAICETKTDTTTVVAPKYITISNDVLKKELLLIENDSSEFILKNKDSVLAFYKLREKNAAWKSIKDRNFLYNAIKTADTQGLNPNEYNFTKIKEIVTTDPFNKKNNVAIDLLLTDTYLTYAYHLANGKTNPKKLYNDWRLTPNVFQFNSLLNTSLNNNNLSESLKKYIPQNKI